MSVVCVATKGPPRSPGLSLSHHPGTRASLPSTLPGSERSPSCVKIPARLTAVFSAPGGAGQVGGAQPSRDHNSVLTAGSWWLHFLCRKPMLLRVPFSSKWSCLCWGRNSLRAPAFAVASAQHEASTGKPPAGVLGGLAVPQRWLRWRPDGGWSWERCLGWGVTLVL